MARSSPAPMPEALVAAIARAEASAQDALPPGPGRALVESRCAPCHSVAIVTQQRKTRAGWVKTVGVMKTWGAPLSPDEEVVLLEYLTTCFGAPEPP